MGGWVAFIYGMALFGSTYLVPVFMQIALKLPPSQAGAVLLPAGWCWRSRSRWPGGSPTAMPVSRSSASACCCWRRRSALMVGVGLATSLWSSRCGRSSAHRARLRAAVAQPRRDARPADAADPQGSSGINFLRQLGGAVGVNLVGIVLEWRLRVHAARRCVAFHETFAMLALITAAAVIAAWRMTPPKDVSPL
jgi:hypothetical protein